MLVLGIVSSIWTSCESSRSPSMVLWWLAFPLKALPKCWSVPGISLSALTL